MSVTSVEKDLEALTMTVRAELEATAERAWNLWADPRQFEKWWGPPGYPVTVIEHDLRAGGRITFFMAGPEGERHNGTWEIAAADPPRASPPLPSALASPALGNALDRSERPSARTKGSLCHPCSPLPDRSFQLSCSRS